MIFRVLDGHDAVSKIVKVLTPVNQGRYNQNQTGFIQKQLVNEIMLLYMR
jgi:hypothetical protein